MSESRTTSRHREDEVWRRLSEELGGEFIDEPGWRQDKVVVHADSWIVTLDIHNTAHYKHEGEYTRFRAAYPNPEYFRLNIYHQGFWSWLGHLLGSQDVRTGYPEIDKQFVVKTNNEAMLKRVIADADLRQMLAAEPQVHLHVRDSGDWFADRFPAGIDELVLEVEGRVQSLERLESLYRLFATALRLLGDLGHGAD